MNEKKQAGDALCVRRSFLKGMFAMGGAAACPIHDVNPPLVFLSKE